MKYLILVSLVLGMSVAYAKEPSKPVLPQDKVTDCGYRSLLYNIAARIRDDEVPRKQALLEFKKQSRISDMVVAEDILRIVYTDLESRTPNWIEGYVYGLCIAVSSSPSPISTIPQQKRQM